jgi:hypothetical protein
MTKELRQQVYDKYDGKCAYTGKPLPANWQIDHVYPVGNYQYHNHGGFEDKNDINNLIPALAIINHYKRCLRLEDFRQRMLTFHLRLAKLPKQTKVQSTVKRKEYMQKVADLFEITVDKPFTGTFYFEKEVKNV